MEENIFDALPGFDRMLEQKTFAALSERERGLVLQFITEEDYTRFRESVRVVQPGRDSREHPLTPDPLVKDRLMQTFSSAGISPSSTVPGMLSRFLSYRIPFYQAGLAASVLLFFVFYLFLQNYRMARQVAIADTVYVDKPVLLKDTVWMEKPEGNKPGKVQAENRNPETRNTPAVQSFPENKLYASQMRDAMSRMSVISGLGKDKSLTHDAGLMKLVSWSAGALVSSDRR